MPIVGFKTAKGSVYAVDNPKEGFPKQTSRLKVSFGEGRGKLDDRSSMCLFVSEAGADIIDRAMVDKKSVFLFHNEGDKPYEDGQALTRVTYENASNVPAAKSFLYGIIGANGQWEGLVAAYPEPKVGLRPMEQLFAPDGSITNHIGNGITELYDKPSELLKATMQAMKTLEHTASRQTTSNRG